MKTSSIGALLVSLVLVAGCAGGGAYAPVNPDKHNLETGAKFVLMDSGAQRSVTAAALQEKVLEDGRLEVAAVLRNRESRRIQVQVQCVFKDAQGIATGDETPWQDLILTENGMETFRAAAMNTQAKGYTVRVRQAR